MTDTKPPGRREAAGHSSVFNTKLLFSPIFSVMRVTQNAKSVSMAKLPALVTALSQCDHRERPALELIGRFVREAGFIATTKRGSGASDMSFKDAAMLLIGSFADGPSQAASTVSAYSRLPNQHVIGSSAEFAEITNANNLGEAVEALIVAADDIRASFEAYIDQAYTNYDDAQRGELKKSLIHGNFARVELELARPYPYAEIRIIASPSGDDQLQFQWRFRADPGFLQAIGFKPRVSDRTVRETIGLQTLLSLHNAVVSGGS